MILHKKARVFHPKFIVHLCFSAVFLFSTFLTWHEALVLKRTWESNQLARLSTAANVLDNQWQHNLDELTFFSGLLEHAIDNPLNTDKSQALLRQFASVRNQPQWHLNSGITRGIPLNGISDERVTRFPLFSRSSERRLNDELKAVLEMSLILQFNQPDRDFYSRFWYISRAGFYLSSTLQDADSENLLNNFVTVARRPYFVKLEPAINPKRSLVWSGLYDSIGKEGKVVTVARPVDRGGYWYGALAMDFPLNQIEAVLLRSLAPSQEGTVMLTGRDFAPIARSDASQREDHQLSPSLLAALRTRVSESKSGNLRIDGRLISWVHLNYFDGMLVSVQTLREGLLGNSGRVGRVLLIMWLMFSLLLLVSHQAIIRMTGSLLKLQEKLSWRANYDGLTHLLNRTAFFYKAGRLAKIHQRQQSPVSLIQIDLDYFKSVNDSLGHQTGDRVLAYTAWVIRQQVRKADIAGRVGGEEFCIMLPATSLAEATAIAERIRRELADKPLVISKRQTVAMTASMGVSSSEEQNSWQVDRLQSVADRRLYLAKQDGRNCVRHRD